MKLYAGIDLHSNNNYLVILDEDNHILFDKRLANNLFTILDVLKSFQPQIEGVAVESTYNWYWLVDALIEQGYKVHLVNTAAIQQYSGIKHTNDKTDATWLAKMLRQGLLPEGYIYPKEQRGLRELLRRRCWLVQKQTMQILSLKAMLARYKNINLTAGKIKQLQPDDLNQYFSDQQVFLAACSQLTILKTLIKEIDTLEQLVVGSLKEDKAYQCLKSIPGVGTILASVIAVETGSIQRFPAPGNYTSYCRCVESKRISNSKKKGENNRKNGNAYLAWAFMEAANSAIRYYLPIKSFYQRKINKVHRVVALKAVAHKLARASYFIQRDQVEFDMRKAFS